MSSHTLFSVLFCSVDIILISCLVFSPLFPFFSGFGIFVHKTILQPVNIFAVKYPKYRFSHQIGAPKQSNDFLENKLTKEAPSVSAHPHKRLIQSIPTPEDPFHPSTFPTVTAILPSVPAVVKPPVCPTGYCPTKQAFMIFEAAMLRLIHDPSSGLPNRRSILIVQE